MREIYKRLTESDLENKKVFNKVFNESYKKSGTNMTVRELKSEIEKLPDDFEIVISADIGGDRPFNFYELKDISVDIGYSSKCVHFFGTLDGDEE